MSVTHSAIKVTGIITKNEARMIETELKIKGISYAVFYHEKNYLYVSSKLSNEKIIDIVESFDLKACLVGLFFIFFIYKSYKYAYT